MAKSNGDEVYQASGVLITRVANGWTLTLALVNEAAVLVAADRDALLTLIGQIEWKEPLVPNIENIAAQLRRQMSRELSGPGAAGYQHPPEEAPRAVGTFGG
jgi:hypothetical protein